MALTEITKKRIGLIVLIAAAVLGALFMIFAFFLNKGTLIINGKAPYLVSIQPVKSVACNQDECKIEIAPGQYNIAVIKDGYREVDKSVSVPIGGETKEQIDFMLVPKLTVLGEEKDLKIFSQAEVTGDDLPKENLFYDNGYVLYIERDAGTHRQTLYVRSVENGKAGTKTVVTSFIRDLKNYVIVPSVEKNNRVGVIDIADTSSTIYVIDLTEKTRNSVVTMPLIKNMKWLPGTDDFIFEGRDAVDAVDSIFLFTAADKKTQKLDLRTDLKDVTAVTKDRLIAATIQYIDKQENLPAQEGKLVVLGEAEASPSAGAPAVTAAAPAPAPVLSFIDYSISKNEARLLKTAPDLTFPASAHLSGTGRSVYYLIDGKVYELTFSD